MITISTLWYSDNASAWEAALEHYWSFVQPRNMALERDLERLELARIRNFSAAQWYNFLHDEYFRWKYTAPNRYATTTSHLKRYLSGGLAELDGVRQQLLALRPCDINCGLIAASSIRGLGIAGASGLLALMYPHIFGTVDQFAVKALSGIEGLPDRGPIAKMNPLCLTLGNAVLLIGIMQQQAAKLNCKFGTKAWTPRRIDKVLWTYGR